MKNPQIMRIFSWFWLALMYPNCYERMDTESMQKIISESASTIVVMNGDATTAGSSLTAFARMGSEQPMSFAMMTVIN